MRPRAIVSRLGAPPTTVTSTVVPMAAKRSTWVSIGQLALDEVAAVDVLLVEPVEAVQFDDVSVEVDGRRRRRRRRGRRLRRGRARRAGRSSRWSRWSRSPCRRRAPRWRRRSRRRRRRATVRPAAAAGPLRDGIRLAVRSWDPSSGSAVKARPSGCKSRARTLDRRSYVPLTGGPYSARPWNEAPPRPRAGPARRGRSQRARRRS